MQAFKQESGVLETFYSLLSDRPYCGHYKKADLIRTKAHAIKFDYIQANTPGMVHWLIFDLDHENPFIWEDKGLPAPNYICRNRNNNRCHIAYKITPVCISIYGKSHPKRYMDAVRRGYAAALDADPDFSGRITKNPFSKSWHLLPLHNYEYSLGELSDYNEIELTSADWAHNYASNDEKEWNAEPGERNVTLFNRLRRWAYANVTKAKEHTNIDAWQRQCIDQAFKTADIAPDFLPSEILSTAKSVAKWTWQHYSPSLSNRGAMGLSGSGLELQEKQKLSADRTNKLRATATEKRIITAYKQLKADGLRISKAALARLTGISRQHLSSRYQQIVNDLIQVQLPPSKTVSSGIYQITASRCEAPKGENLKESLEFDRRQLGFKWGISDYCMDVGSIDNQVTFLSKIFYSCFNPRKVITPFNVRDIRLVVRDIVSYPGLSWLEKQTVTQRIALYVSELDPISLTKPDLLQILARRLRLLLLYQSEGLDLGSD